MKVVMMVLAVTAWFTDAAIDDSVQAPEPAVSLPLVSGTYGTGVLLTKAVAIENPQLSQTRGYISFWLQPRWDGNDGKTHRILRIGDPERNGLLVEKAASGRLRYVMASPAKVTAARADVSHWQVGEWHHIVVAWTDFEGQPVGLPLFIDRKAVAGPIASGNTFLDPAAMEDARVWIGDESSEAVMDELIMRTNMTMAMDDVRSRLTSPDEPPEGLLAMVYRDYFRTAPYTAIRIDPEPFRVPADRRVVAGFQKQFGLEGRREGRMEDMTDFVARYTQWGHFDAKPFITWRTSDENVATVDQSGLVTGGSVGSCKLIAQYRGMVDTYDLEVIPVEQPDLDLAYVERLPRYAQNRHKNNPAPGDEVTSVAHIFNMGYENVPAGTVVTLELFPDVNRNFSVEPDEEKLAVVQMETIGELAPKQEVTVSFPWTWPEAPVWVRVTVDPENRIGELCEANNRRCALNTARALRWGFDQALFEAYHDEKTMTLVGSFSTVDWYAAMVQRLDLILRDAVYPCTSPYGIRDSVYLDMIGWPEGSLPEEGDKEYRLKVQRLGLLWDGGWPQPQFNNPMAIDSAIMHELGHCALCLPDLYGFPMYAGRVYLKDENGELYEGGPLLPYIGLDPIHAWMKYLPMPGADDGVPCGVSYTPLMHFCHLWLCESCAGKVDHFRGCRGNDRIFWGTQGRLIPTWQNYLLVTDVNDRPLAGAAVYVYQVAQNYVLSAYAKFFADRPKFMGNTDQDGRYFFPGMTDKDWDDPTTEEAEHGVHVWNPFGGAQRPNAKIADVAFTPNVWETQGLLLIKVVSGEQTEFHWLTLDEFNIAYYKDKRSGMYPIRTSLQPCEGTTELVRPEIPEAIQKENLAPVAVVEPEELTVEVGQEFTFDGSKSYDPEGQPLVYAEWVRHKGTGNPNRVDGLVYKGVAPDEPGELMLRFYVNDGLHASKRVIVKVTVVEAAAEADAEPEAEATAE